MTSSRLTVKGQVTIPKEIRDKLGVKPGESVEFVEEAGSFYVRKYKDPEVVRRALEKWTGFLQGKEGTDTDALMDELRGPRLTDEEMEEHGRDWEVDRKAKSESKAS